MKPIEIHIEGYKIVISEDKKEPEVTEDKKEPEVTKEFEKITYVPYPVNPTTPQNPDWWKYPFATWTASDVTVTNTTDSKPQKTFIRDWMVGKETDENT